MRKLNYYSHLLTSDLSIKEIKLFGLGGFFFERYKKIFNVFYKEDKSLSIRRQISSSLLSLLSLVGYYGCYVYIIQQTISNNISIGDLTLYSSIFLQLQNNLSKLLSDISAIYENSLFIGNLFEFLDIKPEMKPLEFNSSLHYHSPMVPKTWKEGLILNDVSFKYPNTDKIVLHNINLHIHPGEKIALIGDNGSGKTTLIKLLSRFYDPTEGSITLEGQDLRNYDIESLYKCIGIVFQDYVHYCLSAAENIGLGNIDEIQDLKKIKDAAKKGDAHIVLENLPNGYDTILGHWFDEGKQLSIGEWQKVALARAFMRNAPLLILDEPTSSLDVRTEYKLFQNIRKLCENRTTILISHRFNTVRMADRILVLDKGKIIEEGNHELLINLNGVYAKLFKMQSEQYLIN